MKRGRSRRVIKKRVNKNKRRTLRRQLGGNPTAPTAPTFHIIIATAGRPSLSGLLDSMKGQLRKGDAITIVFDGPTAKGKSGFNDKWLNGIDAVVNVFEENPALGMWGHNIRTKYQAMLTPRTTYIMHADDDDKYTAGAFDALRLKCVDPSTLYIAKMNSISHPEVLIPRQNEKIIESDIGTPCGIIPFDKASGSIWEHSYGGDFQYYNKLQTTVKAVVFLDTVIYTVGK